MNYLLDTNVFIHAAKNVGRVREQMGQRSPETLATSVVTLAELMYGAQKTADKERTRQKWLGILAPLTVVEFTALCAHEHAAIRYQLRHNPIGERDLLIASMARAYGLIVVTHNLSEFSRVSELRCEDWV